MFLYLSLFHLSSCSNLALSGRIPVTSSTLETACKDDKARWESISIGIPPTCSISEASSLTKHWHVQVVSEKKKRLNVCQYESTVQNHVANTTATTFDIHYIYYNIHGMDLSQQNAHKQSKQQTKRAPSAEGLLCFVSFQQNLALSNASRISDSFAAASLSPWAASNSLRKGLARNLTTPEDLSDLARRR